MELPHMGVHCNEPSCNRLDFLPVKCDACSNSFCMDHMTYSQHNCPTARNKDVQVPVCPLCNNPVASPRNQAPDIAVGQHIDRDCQSDPAQIQRKKNRNKCCTPGCKVKEIIPVLCADCHKNFCLRHRFPQDHACVGKRGLAAGAAQSRIQQKHTTDLRTRIQGNMSEDEAMMKAIAASLANNQEPVHSARNSNNPRCQVS